MRLVERIAAVDDASIARYRAAERSRLGNLAGSAGATLLAALASTPDETIRERIAKGERARLRKQNAPPSACGAPPADAVLDRAGIESLLTQIRGDDTDSEKEAAHLVALLERSVPDPLVIDYIFHPELDGLSEAAPTSELLVRAFGHPARVLALRVHDALLENRTERRHLVTFLGPSARRAFATMRPPVLPRPGEVWAVALVGAILPDGRRVQPDMRAEHRSCCEVLGRTEHNIGVDLTDELRCRPGEWIAGRGWV